MFGDESDSDHFNLWCPSGISAWLAVRIQCILVHCKVSQGVRVFSLFQSRGCDQTGLSGIIVWHLVLTEPGNWFCLCRIIGVSE